jgi:pyruvate carboxylase
VAINGNPEMKGRTLPKLPLAVAIKPACDLTAPVPQGTRDLLKQLGAQEFSHWMKAQPQVLLTDTTMRDAHQSLFATRMRSHDMVAIAPHITRACCRNCSRMECWGGATFDVACVF